MDYRKLIKFGGNSYVISLPTKWIKENKIKKGDLVNVEREDSILHVSPHMIKRERETISEMTIDLDKIKTEKDLRPHLTAAYINGYDQITIIGKDLTKYAPKIRELIKNFIALEIIEQTAQKIILKEFVDLQEASLQEVVRRIDRIIISMTEDAEKHLLGEGDFVDILKQKDTDISRLYHYVFRAIKCSLKPEQRAIKKLSVDDILYYWELTTFLERVANQIKRIPRYAPSKTPLKVLNIYRKIMQHYKDTMKANYTKNAAMAIELINRRKEVFDECETLNKYLPKQSHLMAEKMKNATENISQLSKTFLRHYYT